MQEHQTQQLLQGENPETQHVADARRWIAIYSQLLTFNEELLDRLHREVGGDDGRRGLDFDERIAEGELTRLRERLGFWQRRHRDLAGVDIDETTGILYGAEGAIPLTTRRRSCSPSCSSVPIAISSPAPWRPKPGTIHGWRPSRCVPMSCAFAAGSPRRVWHATSRAGAATATCSPSMRAMPGTGRPEAPARPGG